MYIKLDGTTSTEKVNYIELTVFMRIVEQYTTRFFISFMSTILSESVIKENVRIKIVSGLYDENFQTL